MQTVIRISVRCGLLLTIALVFACGCSTVTTAAQLIPTLFFTTAQTQLRNSFGRQTVVASAGPDQLVLTGQTVILNGSASAVRLGGGTLQPSPEPPLTFAWTITSSPVGDLNNDGAVDDADLALAGVKFVNTDTPLPQFTSPVPGNYVVELNVSWTSPLGLPASSTDVAQVDVVAPAP